MNVLAPKIKPELLRELAKLVGKPEDLFGPDGLFQELKKSLVEQLLEVEIEDHLGYPKGDQVEGGRRPNSRNGYSVKSVKTESGTDDRARAERSRRQLRAEGHSEEPSAAHGIR